MINYILTSDMTREDWLATRKHFVGASESAALLGKNPYQTAVEIYARKVGLIPEGLEDNHMLRYGREMEPVIAKFFQEDTGHKVQNDNKVRFHQEYEFIACNLDRAGLSYGDWGPFVHEIKTTSENMWNAFQSDMDAENPVPYIYHYIQVQHQLAVTGWKHAWMSYEISGFTKNLEHIHIKRNEHVIERIISACVKFWTLNVEKGIAPDPVNTNDAKLLWPDTMNGKKVEATDEIQKHLKRIKELNTEKTSVRDLMKVIDEKIDTEKAAVAAFMQDSEFLTSGDDVLVSYKTTKRKGYTVEPTEYRTLRPKYNNL